MGGRAFAARLCAVALRTRLQRRRLGRTLVIRKATGSGKHRWQVLGVFGEPGRDGQLLREQRRGSALYLGGWIVRSNGAQEFDAAGLGKRTAE